MIKLFLLITYLTGVNCDKGSTVKRTAKIPPDWLKRPLSNIACGEAVNLSEAGFARFIINSKGKECHHAIIGSKRLSCTAGVYCDGEAGWNPVGRKGSKKEFMVISDGSIGEVTGYGNFYFDGAGRIPRNGGYDIFITYKGVARSDFQCVVFCKEDVNWIHGFKVMPLEESGSFEDFPIQGNCECGKKPQQSGRVVGGEEAEKFEYPWLAAIGDSSIDNRISLCGGALITDRHVLTAAHCIVDVQPDSKFYVLLHAHKLNKYPGDWPAEYTSKIKGWDDPPVTDEEENTIRINFDKSNVLIHPLYQLNETGRYRKYDVGLITLTRPIKFEADKVSPICLPEPGEGWREHYDQPHALFAGWGRTSANKPGTGGKENQAYFGVRARYLQKTVLALARRKDCKIDTLEGNSILCAGHGKAGADLCKGDYGAPMMQYNDNTTSGKYVCVGVLSVARCQPHPKYAPLFASLLETISWVLYHTTKTNAEWCTR